MTDDLETQLLELAARVRLLEEANDPAAIASIHEKLDELLNDTASKPRLFHWPDLEPDDLDVLWPAFLTWVQNVLCARYPAANNAFRDCWWQHPDALDAVTAAWFDWCGSYRNGEAKFGDPAIWQGTRLPALIGQLAAAMSSCDHGHMTPAATCDAMRTVPTDYGQIGAGAIPRDH